MENELTQRKVARKLGFDEATISRWATGLQFPKAEEMTILLDFFGYRIEFVKNEGDGEMEQRIMTLAEVETCDSAYLVYEQEDPISHLFTRVRTDDENILFERDLGRFIKSQPYLRKDLYGIKWVAFAERPRKCVIDKWRWGFSNNLDRR